MQEQMPEFRAASGVLCHVFRQNERALEVDCGVNLPAPSQRERSYVSSSFLLFDSNYPEYCMV